MTENIIIVDGMISYNVLMQNCLFVIFGLPQCDHFKKFQHVDFDLLVVFLTSLLEVPKVI